jgi:hypothetical protein
VSNGAFQNIYRPSDEHIDTFPWGLRASGDAQRSEMEDIVYSFDSSINDIAVTDITVYVKYSDLCGARIYELIDSGTTYEASSAGNQYLCSFNWVHDVSYPSSSLKCSWMIALPH